MKRSRRRIAELEAIETGHKRVEKALQESELQYRATLNSMGDAIHVIDKNIRFVLFNDAFKRWNEELGLETDVIGRTLYEVFPFLPNKIGDEYLRVFKTGKTLVTEENTKLNDREFSTETRKIPIFEGGKVTRVVTVVRNITDRKRAEEQVRESQQRFQGLVETLSDWIWEVDQNGIYTYASPKVRNLLGYKPEEVLGKTPFDLMPIEEAQRVKGIFEQLRAVRQPLIALENINRHKDGHLVVLETSGIPFFDTEGRLKGYRGVDRDITDRKHAEEALRESEEKYRDLVENIDDIIYATDEHGIITYIAPRIEDVGGYTTSEIIGRPFLEFVHKEDIPYMRDKFEQDLSGRAEPHEYRAVNKAGKVRWVHVSSRPFFKGTRVVGLRGVLTDITDRKHAEEELERSYQQLRETFIETVNALASTVEMKDPYTAGHQRWATRLACAIAKEMGLSEEQIEGIRMAASIHDIGKINIPAEILSKPGQLSEIQYNMVKIHAQVGCDILREIKFPWPVAEIVLQHHERWDGSGYPERLLGEEIILEARILAVADTVEAMSSHRPYRVAHGIDSALEEISQNRGTLYDPAVVDACLTLFEKGFRFD